MDNILSSISEASPRGQLLRAGMVIGILTLYSVLAMAVMPTSTFLAPDQGSKLLQVQSLVASGFRSAEIPYLACWLDPEMRLSPLRSEFGGPHFHQRGGRYYSVFTIYYGLLAALLYKLLGYAGLYVPSVVGAVGTSWLAALVARELRVRYWPLVFPTLALTSHLFFYGLEFWEHALATCMSTLSLYLVVLTYTRPQRQHLHWLLSGATAALTPLLREEHYVFAPSLALAIALTARPLPPARRAGLAIVGLLLVWTPAWIANTIREGYPLGYHLTDAFRFIEERVPGWTRGAGPALNQWRVIKLTMVPTRWYAWMPVAVSWVAVWFLGRGQRAPDSLLPLDGWGLVVAWVWSAGVFVSRFPLMWPANIGATAASVWEAFPFLLVMAYALVNRRFSEPDTSLRQATRLVALTGGIYALIILVRLDEWGGMGWGPRFLLTSLPGFAALGWMMVDRMSGLPRSALRSGLLGAVALLIVVGAVTQAIGVRKLYIQKVRNQVALQATTLLEPPLVVAGRLDAILKPAANYHSITYLAVKNTEQLALAMQLLCNASQDRFWWVIRRNDDYLTDELAAELGLELERVEPVKNNIVYRLYRIQSCRTSLSGDD